MDPDASERTCSSELVSPEDWNGSDSGKIGVFNDELPGSPTDIVAGTAWREYPGWHLPELTLNPG